MKRKNLILAGLIAAFSLSATLATANLLQNGENANVAYAEEVAESTADFAMINGASVRYSVGSTGMRFQAYMTEAKYTEVMKADSVTFGMVILPYEYVTAYGAVSEETLFGENAKYVGNVQAAGKTTVLEYKATELDDATGNRGAGRYFNCAIVNILPSNYEKEFYATAYYAATTNGVTTYEFTAANETNRRTVEYVSTVAMTKDENMTAEKLAILNGFAYRGDSGADKAENFSGGQIENDIYVSEKAKNVTLSAIDSTLETVAITDENGGLKISGTTANSGFRLSLQNVKAGQKYTLTFTAKSSGLTDGFKLNTYHYKDGALYDGIAEYNKSYTVTALTSELAEYSVNVETAAIGYDEIVLDFVQGAAGAYEMILDEIALVEVGNIEITEIPAKNQLVAGTSVDLDAKLNGLNGVLTWASSNANVAKISTTGELTAVAAGKAEITATLTNGETTYEDYFSLYVLPETADASKVELVYEPSLPVDFVLNVPADRELRILQLTDTQLVDPSQIREGSSLASTLIRSWSGEDAVEGNCLEYIDRVFSKIETTPDLVVLTGDNVYGKYDDNGKMLDKVIAALEEKGVYWTFAFGNHDKESDIGIEAILRKYAKAEHCLYAYRNVTGDSNVSIAVKQGSAYTRLLFTFDTNSTGANRVDTYALVYQGVYESQQDWYKETVTEFLTKTGMTSIPSSVFLHIPFNAVVTALDALGDMAAGFEIEDETGTNFGGCYGEIGGWDPNNTFFNMLKTYGTDGVFMGHYHTVNASVVYEGIRFTFGTKTSTYDEYRQGMLGGTLIEANATNFAVEHVYAVEKNVEDYDLAREYQDNNLRTSTFWTASMHFDLTVTDQDLPEGGSGKAMKATKNEGDTGWAYLRFRLLPLKAGQYYKISFNLNFATANDYGNTFAFNGYITPNAEITESEAIGKVPTTTKDGLIEIYFTSPTDTTTSSLYLSFYNWNSETNGLNDYFTLDNLKLEESVWSDTKLENDDGTFSGNEGNISVLAATEIKGSADDGWASALTLFKTNDPAMTPNGTTDTALRVTSSGGHNWSFVYIKFNTPITKDTVYTISFDAKWNGVANPVGFHYSIDKGNGSNDEQLVGYQPISYDQLFKVGNTITFNVNESVDYFYLRIISNSNENEATRTPFDFTIDNIKLSLHSINTDGTFEGTAGNITLLSNKNTEITQVDATFNNAKLTYLTSVTKDGNTAVRVQSSNGSGNSFFFIKFNQAVTANKTYKITFNAVWNNDVTYSGNLYYAYSSTPSEVKDIKGYAKVVSGTNTLENSSLTFEPKSDYSYFYLCFHINTSTFGFDFTIDNIAISEVTA